MQTDLPRGGHRWLRDLLRPERRALRHAWLLALLTALAGMGLLGLSGWFLSAAALAGVAAGGPAVAFNLLAPSAGIHALALGRTGARYLERLVSHEATFRVMHRLRTTLFAAILPRVPGPLSRFSGGQLLERLLGDVERLENAWLGQGQPLLTAGATGLLLLGLCAAVASPVALLVLCLAFAAMAGLLFALSRYSRAPLRDKAHHRDSLRASLIQALNGLPEVLAYDIRARIQVDWRQRLADLADIEHRLAVRQAVTQTLTQGLMQWLAVGLLLVLVGPVSSGAISGPLALALMLLVLGAAEVTQPLAAAAQRLPETGDTIQRVRALTDAPAPVVPMQGTAIPAAPAALEVHDLSFAWPGGDSLFQNLSFQASPREPLAVVGPSGCGKSTLLHCLMGLQSPSGGGIALGAVAQAQASPDAWRRQFSLLLQQQQLFTGTLRDNLRLARPDADDGRLWHVLEQVRLADTVRQRGGLDLWIGVNGLHLSGGQGRRLSLARVLLRDSPVVLLDEPFTGLETASADRLFTMLQDTLADRTLIMVTHDPRQASRLPRQLSLNG